MRQDHPRSNGLPWGGHFAIARFSTPPSNFNVGLSSGLIGTEGYLNNLRFLRQRPSLTTHSDCIAGVWVIDWQSRQGYNVSVMAPFER